MERSKMEEVKSTNPLNQDEIQIYLKDIRKLKVMTPERERFLAERICSKDCTEKEKKQIQLRLPIVATNPILLGITIKKIKEIDAKLKKLKNS